MKKKINDGSWGFKKDGEAERNLDGSGWNLDTEWI